MFAAQTDTEGKSTPTYVKLLISLSLGLCSVLCSWSGRHATEQSKWVYLLPSSIPYLLFFASSSIPCFLFLSPSFPWLLSLPLECVTKLYYCRRYGHSIFLPDHEEAVHSSWVGADWDTTSLRAETAAQLLQILGTHNITNVLACVLSSLCVLVSKGEFH